MASLGSPSTWAFSPNPTSSPTTKITRSFKSFKPLLASSNEAAPADKPEVPGPLKLAFSKAKAYRKSKEEQNPVPESTNKANGSGGQAPEVSAAVKLAMEKAKEYRKNKAVGGSTGNVKVGEPINSGQEKNMRNSEGPLKNKAIKKEEPKISSIDFVGLEFSDKKNYRGLPPGLRPVMEPLLEGEAPEVEIIVGDVSNFETTTPQRMTSSEDTDSTDIYKPKVATWGVFPRPSNISKTFGGGRVIRPGEVLETAEDKAAKEKHTKELIANYKSKMGLTIDARTKSECEKALKEGDNLMDLGKLREALPYYDKVMKDMPFQNELHGLAALQWAICQDSLHRSSEARSMYEKLESHPNVQVSKKARQFAFSFQAMEMMKVKSTPFSGTTGYENYFDAFVENKANYTSREEEEKEGALRQALPYIMFLLSPIFIVLIVALSKPF